MTTTEIINVIIAGGLLGTLGQGIRMAIGLKKLSDVNSVKGLLANEQINGTRILISLFIGFVAGSLFLLVKGTGSLSEKDFIFSVIATGYSGADFIEGLFRTYLPSTGDNTIPKKPVDEKTLEPEDELPPKEKKR
jgi:hypothetical protein